MVSIYLILLLRPARPAKPRSIRMIEAGSGTANLFAAAAMIAWDSVVGWVPSQETNVPVRPFGFKYVPSAFVKK